MISTADVLARALANVRGGWCRGAYARNEHGEEVLETAPDAVAFCALGAIRRAACDAWDAEIGGALLPPSAREHCEVRGEAERVLCEALGFDGLDTEYEVTEWNDARGRKAAAVVEAFGLACEIAKADA